MRPEGINDLQVLWAIRSIPSTIITFDQRSILFYLLSVIGNREYCYYSLEQLSEILGVSENFLRYRFNELQEMGFIKIIRPDNQGRGKANEYYLLYDKIMTFSVERKGAGDAPFNESKGAPHAPFKAERVHSMQLKGAPHAPQDIHKEIHKNRKEESSFFNQKNQVVSSVNNQSTSFGYQAETPEENQRNFLAKHKKLKDGVIRK